MFTLSSRAWNNIEPRDLLNSFLLCSLTSISKCVQLINIIYSQITKLFLNNIKVNREIRHFYTCEAFSSHFHPIQSYGPFPRHGTCSFITIIYPREQYCKLGVTTRAVKARHCGARRRYNRGRARATRKRRLEAGRIKSHYPEGAIPAILAPTGLCPFHEFFRVHAPAPVFEALFADRKIFRELCVSFAWLARPAMKSHRQEFP